MVSAEQDLAVEQRTTADELLRLSGTGRYELVKGVLISMSPPGYQHAAITMRVALHIANHVAASQLGDVAAAEAGFRLGRDPDTVRAPNIAFVSNARKPASPPQGYPDLAPDLAVEVVSPNDNADELLEKVQDFLAAGTRMVWVVFPKTRSIAVYRSLRDVQILRGDDVLTADDVLPGFERRVNEVFE